MIFHFSNHKFRTNLCENSIDLFIEKKTSELNIRRNFHSCFIHNMTKILRYLMETDRILIDLWVSCRI